jgi:DNA excision repair protein ERCC-1
MDGPTPGTLTMADDTATSASTGVVNQNPQRPYTNAVLVRRNQKGNPLMEHLRNVPWQYGDILADYEVGRTTGVLFLR